MFATEFIICSNKESREKSPTLFVEGTNAMLTFKNTSFVQHCVCKFFVSL